jgi:hypothetical protein
MAFANHNLKAIAGEHCSASQAAYSAADDDDFCVCGGDRNHVFLRYFS